MNTSLNRTDSVKYVAINNLIVGRFIGFAVGKYDHNFMWVSFGRLSNLKLIDATQKGLQILTMKAGTR